MINLQKASQEDNELLTDFNIILYILAPLIGFALIATLFFAGTVSAGAIIIMFSLACLMSGAFIGFLFGIPKILQTEKLNDTKNIELHYRQQVNTNLEQISDWLTKIIVGLGLINLKSIPSYLIQIAEILTVSIGSSKENTAFALGLIVYFSIVGFLAGYLFTRLFLAGAFFRADLSTAQTKKYAENIKGIAEEVNPDLFQQILANVPPKTIIEGESNKNTSNELQNADDEPDEKEDFNKAFDRIQQK